MCRCHTPCPLSQAARPPPAAARRDGRRGSLAAMLRGADVFIGLSTGNVITDDSALRRKAGIHEFTDAFVQSAPVQQMMARVTTILDPDIGILIRRRLHDALNRPGAAMLSTQSGISRTILCELNMASVKCEIGHISPRAARGQTGLAARR